jgi:NAD(P)-dependent dehydrogenase (short-subunit alcohol dehydrogenase family)
MSLSRVFAVVTGAASGLGNATAVHLAKNGAKVSNFFSRFLPKSSLIMVSGSYCGLAVLKRRSESERNRFVECSSCLLPSSDNVEIRSIGAHFAGTNVASEESVAEMLQTFKSVYGRTPNTIVNCAGNPPPPFHSIREVFPLFDADSK